MSAQNDNELCLDLICENGLGRYNFTRATGWHTINSFSNDLFLSLGNQQILTPRYLSETGKYRATINHKDNLAIILKEFQTDFSIPIPSNIISVAISECSGLLAILRQKTSEVREIHIIRLSDSKTVAIRSEPNGREGCPQIHFAKQGTVLVSISAFERDTEGNGRAAFYALKPDGSVNTVKIIEFVGYSPQQFAFSPDGEWMVTAGYNGCEVVKVKDSWRKFSHLNSVSLGVTRFFDDRLVSPNLFLGKFIWMKSGAQFSVPWLTIPIGVILAIPTCLLMVVSLGRLPILVDKVCDRYRFWSFKRKEARRKKNNQIPVKEFINYEERSDHTAVFFDPEFKVLGVLPMKNLYLKVGGELQIVHPDRRSMGRISGENLWLFRLEGKVKEFSLEHMTNDQDDST